MFPTLFPFLSLFLAVAAPALASSATSRLSNVTITSFSAQGPGCPKGTVSTTLSKDGTAITFGFDAFQVYVGPGFSLPDRVKNCAMLLELSYPLGHTFVVLDATYRGSAVLDVGMNGTVESLYAMADGGAGDRTVQTQASVAGTFAGGYTKTGNAMDSWRMGSVCGRDEVGLQITTRVAVRSSNPSVSGSIITDDAPFSLAYQQLRLGWSACEG